MNAAVSEAMEKLLAVAPAWSRVAIAGAGLYRRPMAPFAAALAALD